MKVLVCGGRGYNDRDRVFAVLDAMVEKRGRPDIVVHGAAKGADSLAHTWAVSRQISMIAAFPAQWDALGKAAGHKRNRDMIDTFTPDLVVAFPGGPGTAGMIRLSRDAGIPVVEVPA